MKMDKWPFSALYLTPFSAAAVVFTAVFNDSGEPQSPGCNKDALFTPSNGHYTDFLHLSPLLL